ncbi:hypothetical protein VNO77_46812 [Canavalia gladiata]|uniref:Uncharacterized protein n=1 Tax=Canavalia gladiata TaxID=3824 RepID=A0AAN9PHZ2_CANGL
MSVLPVLKRRSYQLRQGKAKKKKPGPDFRVFLNLLLFPPGRSILDRTLSPSCEGVETFHLRLTLRLLPGESEGLGSESPEIGIDSTLGLLR